MHDSSMALMRELLGRLPPLRHTDRVLEIGSRNINGSYRELFPENQDYTGVDLELGAGVDVVGNIIELATHSRFSEGFDLVVSGQALEHDPVPWLHAGAAVECAKEGGHVVLIAPFVFPIHHEPDYWRFTPAGLEELLRRSLEVDGWNTTFTKAGLAGDDAYAFCRKVPRVESV